MAQICAKHKKIETLIFLFLRTYARRPFMAYSTRFFPPFLYQANEALLFSPYYMTCH